MGRRLVKHTIIVDVSIGAIAHVSAYTCACRDHQTTGAQPGAIDQFQQP
jgi:hypothetical protein